MYHQFMLLANLNITKEPMEVGPTTHYIMGGVRVDAETQMSNVPGLFAAGEVAAGLHGANRLGGNSLSDLLVFGKRAGEFAAKFAREHDAGQIHDGQIEEAALEALEPFERAAKAAGNAEGPYQVQIDLQEMMQSLVGIVRRKEEMVRALDGLGKLWKRSQNVAVHGHREYNPGWHTAIDLKHLLTVSEAITRSALERKESRGGHFRDDFPNKDAAGGKMNIVLRKDVDGSMRVRREPIPERFSKSGAATRTAETSWSASRKFPRAWSCSTPSTRFKRRRPMTSPAGGIAKLANAVPAQRKLMACRSSCA